MSKMNSLAAKFLTRKGEKKDLAQKGFVPHNSFRSIFNADEDESEDREFLAALFEKHLEESEDYKEISKDLEDLVKVTSELKSIQKQAVLLVGERIFQVRRILKSYAKESDMFISWVDRTFSSRKSAYNALAFYEFYSSLDSDELKTNYKKMPAKISYIIASKKADYDKKVRIVEQYQGQKQKEMLEIIDEELTEKKALAKTSLDATTKTLMEMQRLTHVLKRRMNRFGTKHREILQEVKAQFMELE
jgi:hypothetical protein